MVSDMVNWASLTNELRISISALVQSPKITFLQLRGIIRFPVRLLQRGNITDLCLEAMDSDSRDSDSIDSEDSDNSEDSDESEPTFSASSRLRSLVAMSSSSFLSSLLGLKPNGSPSESVTDLSNLSSLHAYVLNPGDSALLMQMVKSTQNSLTTFGYYVFTHDGLPILSELTNAVALRNISIYTNYKVNNGPERDDILSFCNHFSSSSSAHTPLHSINMTITVPDWRSKTALQIAALPSWTSLDAFSKFQSMKAITLHVDLADTSAIFHQPALREEVDRMVGELGPLMRNRFIGLNERVHKGSVEFDLKVDKNVLYSASGL